MNINLHIHSVHSDGTYTCKDLINIIIENGIELVSLTDHDTMKGVPEFIPLCESNSIKCIPGVEISSRIENLFNFLDEKDVFSFHVLGYFPTTFNYDYIEKVNVLKETIPNIFKSIKFIHELGGVAILAHPFYGIKQSFDLIIQKYTYSKVKISNDIVEKIIKKCMDYPIDGIEAYYEDNTDEDTKYLVEIAKSYNLKTSVGTDFHKRGNSIISKYNKIEKYNFFIW